MNFIHTGDGISITTNSGETFFVGKQEAHYWDVAEALDESDYDSALLLLEQAASDPIVLAVSRDEELSLKHGDVYFRDYKLHGSLVEILRASLEQGHRKLTHFKAFLNRLFSNTSKRAREHLYDFLSYKRLPITPDGYFIGYKGVRSDYYSVYGNTETKVLKGEVDDSGRILNSPGSVIEVDRGDVDDNPDSHCSTGLHVGSMNYASGHGSSVVMVKVDPADVVCVPKDCSCQKLRCSKYEVLEDYRGEVEAASVNLEEGDDQTKVVAVNPDVERKQAVEVEVSYYFDECVTSNEIPFDQLAESIREEVDDISDIELHCVLNDMYNVKVRVDSRGAPLTVVIG